MNRLRTFSESRTIWPEQSCSANKVPNLLFLLYSALKFICKGYQTVSSLRVNRARKQRGLGNMCMCVCVILCDARVSRLGSKPPEQPKTRRAQRAKSQALNLRESQQVAEAAIPRQGECHRGTRDSRPPGPVRSNQLPQNWPQGTPKQKPATKAGREPITHKKGKFFLSSNAVALCCYTSANNTFLILL